jgi:hypothetical protein
MSISILPKVSELEISEFNSSPVDPLYFITEKYHEAASAYPPEEVVNYFNNDQHTLTAFCLFHSEIENGGFIQLIQNGHGDYIFNEPLSEL